MIRLDKLKLFPFKTYEIYFPGVLSTDVPLNFVFYPENSNFNLAYRRLKIPRRFVKYGSIVPSLVPKIIYNREVTSQYLLFKLLPIRNFNESIRNVFFDSTLYMTKLDARFMKGSYRRPMVLGKIQSYLYSVNEYWPGRQNLLIYYVDTTQDIPTMIQNKRGWVLVDAFKRGEFLGFDYILMCVWDGKKSIYYMLKNPDDHVTWMRLYTIINSLKHKIDSNTIEQSVSEISDDIIVTSNIDENDLNTNKIDTLKKNDNIIEKPQQNIVVKQKDTNNIDDVKTVTKFNITSDNDNYTVAKEDPVKNIVKSFLSNKPNLLNSVRKQPLTPYTSKKIVLSSILTKNLKNPILVKKTVQKIPPEQYQQAINVLKSSVVPNILEHDKYQNSAREYVYCDSKIQKINDDKEPSAILNKRKVDFNKNFEIDLVNSLKLLSKKTKYPLYIKSVKSESLPIDPGNLRPTKMRRYSVDLVDEKKKIHSIHIDIPELQSDGTFIINGSKKFMMYQLVIDPIFFLKKNEGKLQTSYATITVFRKLTKYKSYFECYVSGYNIPLALLLMYYIGFDQMCKLFGIKYIKTTTQGIPANMQNCYKLEYPDNTCILIPVQVNQMSGHVYSLLESVKEINGIKSINDLYDKNEIANMLIRQTQNRNSLFKIDQILRNIMEPIAVEVLKSKLLPTQLSGCLLYIAQNIALGRVDDRNDISKQRIRCSEVMSYQIQKQIIASYSQYLMDREHGNDDATYFCDTEGIIKNILNGTRDSSGSGETSLVREVDSANPYDELSCMTRITPCGPGGVQNPDGLSNQYRNIHDSYYGNIDGTDTPEGENIGILNHLTIDALIGNTRGGFGKAGKDEDKGVGILSVLSSVVPFINHDDGCRAMLSCSQAKQAIPIVGNEKPLVQTGYETILTSLLTNSYVKKAEDDGVVLDVTEYSITLQLRNGKKQIIELDHPILKTSVGQIKGSLNTFHSVVRKGQKVKAGQIVAEGKHIRDGVISTGTNALVAVMGWKGYSFEDGYIVSESFAKTKLTSTSYEEKSVLITSDDDVTFIASSGQFTKSGDTLLIRTSKNIQEIIGMDSAEIQEGQNVLKSPGGKIISIEIYPNISLNKFPILKPEFEKFKQRYEETRGKFPTKFYNAVSGESTPFSGIRIVFKIERYDTCVLGDKITNNHGGKGTLTLIEKDENMPVTPWGERVDLIFNPLAIINRMNPGTIYELYSGLIAKCLARRFVSYGYKKNDKAIQLASTVYSMMDNTKDKVLSNNLIKSLKSLTNEQYTAFVNKIIDDNYVMPIYIPQFKEPNMKMIQDTMKFLGLKNTYYLNLPEWKTKTLEPVAVGYLYYKKLEQQAAYKQSVRSIGRYNQSTGQATQGKSAGGGQKVGEMDTWCLISHGAETTLKELFGPMSDDMATKNEVISDIVNNGYANFRQPKASPSTERLKVYLYGTMIKTDL